jgi:beta-glucosidase
MKVFKAFPAIFLALVLFKCHPLQASPQYPFQDPALSIDERAENIVSLLTLDEKISALGNPAVPRLNITAPGRSEGIHQVVCRAGRGGTTAIPTTSFSQVYGMGETWNPSLIGRAGAVLGYEARYISQSEKYNRNTLMLWGPTSDLARDPRWGRTDESFGEDPFLTGTMVVAAIKGMQGDDPKYWQASSLLKHFMANSLETTRSSSSSNFDERLMREYYSVPFRMGFTEGGAKSYMTAYNAWNGIPMVIHPMLKSVVAEEWGAGWVVTPDANAIRHVVTDHRYLKTENEALIAALQAGVNQVLGRGGVEEIKAALDKSLLSELDIDYAIRGKFKNSIRLGLLDPPSMVPYSTIGSAGEPEPWLSEKHRGIALEVARESVVLLKNDKAMLPLDRHKVKSIAVIGPLAGSVLFDFYSGPTPCAVSVLEGIKNKAGPDVAVRYVAVNDNNAAVNAAGASDLAVVVVGNDPMCGTTNPNDAFNLDASTKECPVEGDGREGRDRTSISLPSEELIKEVYGANPRTIVVLVSSFPYAINWSQENVPAILHITHAAQEQGTAIADVLFGDYNPAGRLVQTWPASLEQLLPMEDYDIRNGRTYMYFRGEPLYPFGYGLSYTTFSYSNLRLGSDKLSRNGSMIVSFDVKNTGKRAGDEVVQLYVQHPESKVSRPIKALKGFERITLGPGETITVQITLRAESLAWWNDKQGRFKVEDGPINIMIGASSADIRLSKAAKVY